MMRGFWAVLLVLGWAGAAQAANMCSFDMECFEGEACQETAFDLQFRAGTGGPHEMEIVTDAETIGVNVGGNGKIAHIAGMNDSGFHVLTVQAGSGAARYSVHLNEGPLAITYHGQCEVGG